MDFKDLSKLSRRFFTDLYPQPLVYDTKYHYVVQAGLRFIIFLPGLPSFAIRDECHCTWLWHCINSENCKNSIPSLQTKALNYFLKKSELNKTSEVSDTYCDTIDNSQNMDVPIRGWVDQWNVIYISDFYSTCHKESNLTFGGKWIEPTPTPF